MNKIWNRLKQSAVWAFGFSSVIFTFIPEIFFEKRILPKSLLDFWMVLPVFNLQNSSNGTKAINIVSLTNIVFNRVLILIIAFLVSMTMAAFWSKVKRKVIIKGKDYEIVVKYGDLFKMRGCQKIINFDECFTTEVGVAPWQVKPNSVCGQYLAKNPLTKQEICNLLKHAGLKPMTGKSDFRQQDRYESGILLPHNCYLLMAFAKLDVDGLGRMTRDEYLTCLRRLWKEIDKNYAEKDVCIPVLGSGITRMDDRTLTQQELLDIMIASYKLSVEKINPSHRLIIVCRRNNNFSLSKIGETL